MRKLFIIIFFFLFCHTESFAQKKSLEIGGKLISELTFYDGWAPGIGGQLVYRMSKHSGIETGLYYKIRSLTFLFFTFNNVYQVNINEKNLMFPLLYRFDSRLLNFTAGPILEYLMDWKTKRKDIPGDIDYHTNSLEIMATASVSKTFQLTPKLIFEPEIRFSAFVPNGDGGVALNLSLRKKIF